ncbi:MAG: ABC-2 family transporter protein [Clostridia bacterium]|nr:ABC-2 family transporter protein [Clostridia bacterium]
MILLKKMLAIANINIKVILVYVSAVWANVFVNILQVVILYYIWMAVYGGQTQLHGISKSQIVTYVIISRIIFINGIVSWGINQWISDIIKDGQISIEMLRPIDFQLMTYARRIGVLVFSMILYGVPVIVVSKILFGISLPATFNSGVLFIISFLLAMTINFLVEFFIGLIGFYTTNGWGLQVFKEALLSFLSGALIPIAFFPGWIRQIADFLPFKDIVYTPITIYLGNTSGEQAIKSLLFQFMWVVVLLLCTRIFYTTAIKKVTVQGG